MSERVAGVNENVPPSGTGCVECMAEDSWWFHLRRCAECGHIGCCDQSLGKHATAHFRVTGHPIIASFEPGEGWFYDYETREFMEGRHLAPPRSHPKDQPVPGPQGKVPADWESRLS
ncbi:MAG: UBP-type zinc finger domain-containing protein [Candidatus Cybelea sp.]